MQHLFTPCLPVGARRHWLPLLGLLLAGAPAQAQFAPFASYATANGPSYPALGDLNGDGRPDIVTAGISAASLSVLLGQAGGTFAASTTYATANNGAPFGTALGDLNGDGRLDAVVVNTSNTVGVSVLLGQAGGTFGAATTFPTNVNASAYNVELGDLNADGRLDAVITVGNGSLGVFLGQGNGTFGAPTFFSTGAGISAYNVALGDVNADGRLDAVVSNFGGADGTTVSVLLGAGNGTLGTATQYPVGSAPAGLQLGDLNGDSRPDLVVVNYNSSNVGVLLGQSGGTFGTMTTYTTGAVNPREVALADFNGDGRLDVVTTHVGPLSGGAGTTVGVLLGAGNGTLGTATVYSTGASSRPWGVAAGDVNGDGKPDIVTANRDNNSISVLLNTAIFAPTTTGASRCGSGSVTLTASGAPSGGSYRWYTQASGGTAISGATGSSYVTPTLYGTTTYYVSTVSSTNVESPGRSAVTATINYVAPPSIVAGGPTTINTGGSVTLTARANLALSFSGLNSASSQRVSTNLNAAPSALPNTTWEAWVYPTRSSYGVRQTVFSVDDGNFDRTLVIEGNTDNWGVFTGSGVWEPTTVELNQWQHVAVVYSSTGIKFYKNGVEYVYVGGANTGTTGNRFMFGSNPGFLNESWQGQIDEVRVWSTARTQAEIQATMNAAPAGTAAGLAGFWRLNEGSGSTATDEVGANNGTLQNAPAYVTPGQSSIVASTYAWSPSTGLSSTNTATVTASPSSTQTYTVDVSNGGTCSSSAQQTVTVNQLTDLTISTPQSVPAGSYNNITVTGTGAATLAGDVSVAGTLVVQTGGSLNTNCQNVTGAGSFTLQAGATLSICNAAGITASGATGAVQVTGTRSFSSDANYIYNGSGAQVTGNGLPAQVRNLTSTNTGTLTLSQNLAVREVVTLNAGSLNLNARTLTLLSDAAGTALVANLGAGSVLGTTVTVQRYIDPTLNPGMGYRHLVAPVANATVAAFGSGGTTLVVNPAYNSSTTPNLTTPFPTIFRYDQSRLASSPATTLSAFDKGWASPTNLSDAAQLATTGFTVQLPGASTLSFTGQVGNSSGTISLNRNSGATAADAGWNFIGNPYPSPLDFSTIPAGQRTNMDAAFYTFESTSQYGGQYRSYVNGFGNPLVGTAQAFFVRVSSGQTSGNLALDNSNRVTTYAQQSPVRRGNDTRPQLTLTLSGQGLTDALTVYAQAGATDGADAEFDAVKLLNSTGLNLASLAIGGQEMAIDGRAAFGSSTLIPLAVWVPRTGSYVFTAEHLGNLPAGLTATLVDQQTGARTVLMSGATYAVTLAGTPAPGRFQLEFGSRVTAATPAQLAQQVHLYPNPTAGQLTLQRPASWGATDVEVHNSVGQVVLRQLLRAADTQLDVRSLPAGVYLLHLATPQGPVTKRLVRQ
ncbi:T9SS type A sorting domain-containing protein [Hymenobacter busanensis]|uniref:T9SS type A sorting domain-containing protein n=1 Tax=Hymenobacter busanensis TaxID=2607656 RepID=A0A7L4ZZZ6_9BACT|nr:FG-GAP-like repeat-containing protein [Hymenobacter busanensis]KAA9338731.1 T9SS type A sorting domain-containing protein [Hymenobacter busanensis]QHJ08838.1 T9SS type A sorting domain-containing protein [Hymenobacter busanensis]